MKVTLAYCRVLASPSCSFRTSEATSPNKSCLQQHMPSKRRPRKAWRLNCRCEGPVNAERDAERSKPDAAVWVTKCTNATYRMRLMPHMGSGGNP